jgi:hypothetical protein
MPNPAEQPPLDPAARPLAMPPQISGRSRPWALAALALLIILAVAVPALVAYALAAQPVQSDQRLSDLERRVERLETDVSRLTE